MFTIFQTIYDAQNENVRSFCRIQLKVMTNIFAEDILVEIFRLQRHLKASIIDPEGTTKWIELTFLEYYCEKVLFRISDKCIMFNLFPILDICCFMQKKHCQLIKNI